MINELSNFNPKCQLKRLNHYFQIFKKMKWEKHRYVKNLHSHQINLPKSQRGRLIHDRSHFRCHWEMNINIDNTLYGEFKNESRWRALKSLIRPFYPLSFTRLEQRQDKNDSIPTKIIPVLRLPHFFSRRIGGKKERQFQNWNFCWLNGVVFILF